MKQSVRFLLNDRVRELALPPALTVLDVLRRHLGLTGTKEGCREGECGACTVLVGEPEGDAIRYRAMTSCLLPFGEIDGKHLVTIEGLSMTEPGTGIPVLNPLQRAFADEGASQCGFCTPGFIVSFTGYLLSGEPLSGTGALVSVDGNICRCTGYASIKRAVEALLCSYSLEGKTLDIPFLVGMGLVPSWFLTAGEKLAALGKGAPRRAVTVSAGHGTIIAGGTDIYIQKGDELPEAETVLLSDLDGFRGIDETPDSFMTGAGVTVEDFRKSPVLNRLFPGLGEKLLLVSSTILRNRATLGGNIVNASPIGDLSVLLLAMNAEVLLDGPEGSRRVRLKEFFLGYKKLDMRAGELLKTIIIPKPAGGSDWNFEKVSRRERLDIAGCNSAICLTAQGGVIKDVSLAFGGVAPVPFYAAGVSAFLAGKKIGSGMLRKASGVLQGEIAPISDVRGSASYKGALAVRLLYAHFLKLFPDRLDYETLVRGRGKQ
ncbi:MAG: 2Fe-2S iron-sulfur cluster binding domain-containing protein [Spirochaetales bacterium]|nr:MAG: 2Fe-2S iron-sulfur cluster binding domain-containing protein [Spirochaetales bacterium]